MGDVILLSERRRTGRFPGNDRTGRSASRSARVGRIDHKPAFFFDLGCPFSYLAAERVERLLGGVDWIPTSSLALHRGSRWADPRACALARVRAEERARELRLPL